MNYRCAITSKNFSVTADDARYYEKIGVPPPTLCPEERMRRRLAFINIRNFFKHNGLISPFAPEERFNVVSYADWASERSEQSDGLAHGRPFDFQQTFSEQFFALQRSAPRWNLITYQCENCDWCINCAYCKDSFLIRSSISAHECYHSDKIQRCNDVSDCDNISDSELCYEVIDAERCFEVLWSQDVEGCQHSAFLYDCRNCVRCIACVGLNDQHHHFLNQPVTSDEYLELYARIRQDPQFRSQIRNKFQQLQREYLHPAVRIVNSESCVGDRLWNCHNIYWGFALKNSEDCAYTSFGTSAKDCFDCSQPDEMELCYEVASAYKTYNSKFCFNVLEVRDSDYCETCGYISDCFGCVGLHRKSHCILNKQYPPEEYFKLRAKIITHMKQTGEWGEFLSVKHSPFCYNESVACERFPMTRESALTRGVRWRDAQIERPTNDITVIQCAESGKLFRIQEPEHRFYQKLGVSIPELHPDIRYTKRQQLKNRWNLFPATSALSGKPLLTSIPPERGWKVITEEEYLR